MTVDLLIAGDAMPRPGQPVYPEPASVLASPRDASFIGLAGLFELKLAANRLQDQADVVRIMKGLSDAEYIIVEATLPAARRTVLAHLWDEARQELEWDRAGAEPT